MNVNGGLFETEFMKNIFHEFGSWLLEKQGGKRASSGVKRYAVFFEAMESRWGRIPRYHDLVAYFGPEGLRRCRLAVNWMGDWNWLVIDPSSREVESERRQIDKLFEKLPKKSPARDLAERYLEHLERHQSMRGAHLRSVRLALASVIGLLSGSSIAQERTEPTQADLDRYLQRKPGQRAAITGFVNYLRACGLGIRMPRKPSATLSRAKRERRMLELMAAGASSEVSDREWMKLGLEYFHDVPAREAGRAGADAIMNDSDSGMTVRLSGKTYWIPARDRRDRLPDRTSEASNSIRCGRVIETSCIKECNYDLRSKK